MPASILALCAIPDGRLVSGSADNSVRLWSKKGTEITRIEMDTGVHKPRRPPRCPSRCRA